MKCCYFLFGERKRCWNLGHRHCVRKPEKPPSCESGTNPSINGSKMLSIPVWRAKQEVKHFGLHHCIRHSKKPPSHENDTKQSMKCCHFLFGERNKVPKFGLHHCVGHPEKPFHTTKSVCLFSMYGYWPSPIPYNQTTNILHLFVCSCTSVKLFSRILT